MKFQKGHIPWIKGRKGINSGKNNPFYGKTHTLEVRKKISEFHKGKLPWIAGKHHTKETLLKMSKSLKGNGLGKTVSKETRIKISLAKKGKPSTRKNYHHSEETRRKMGESNKISQKGKIISLETRRKISEYMKKHPRSPWLGKKQPKEMIRKRTIQITGEKNSRWKGGKRASLIRRNFRKKYNGGQHTFGEWNLLKAQYNWTCPACNKSEPEIKLTEDHIIPISLGGSNNIENIQPLCKSCNSKKHNFLIKKYE